MTAIAADGTESKPYRANFDVIQPPAGMTGSQLAHKSASASLTYHTPTPVNYVLVDVGVGAVPEDVPIFGGSPMALLIDVPCHYEIHGDGTAVSKEAFGNNWSFSIYKFDVVPEYSHYFALSYDAAAKKWILNRGDIAVGFDSPELKLGKKKFLIVVLGIPIPMFVQFSVQIALSTGLELEAMEHYDAPAIHGTLDLKGFLAAYLAAGIDERICGIEINANVGVFGGGGPRIVLQYPADPILKDFGIVAKFGLKGELMGLEGEWTLVEQ